MSHTQSGWLQSLSITLVYVRGTRSNALFLGIGPAFMREDIPGTGEHTFSPSNGPDNIQAFMQKL